MTPEELPAALSAAVARLDAAGARDELVAEAVSPKLLGVPRPPRLVPVGRAWRLGVLLLMRDASLRAVGTVIRSGEPAHSALRSRVAEDRLALQIAARRGRIADGQTVNVDTATIDGPASAPLLVVDGEVLLRWAPSSAVDPRPLGDYLEEHIGLLESPPAGA